MAGKTQNKQKALFSLWCINKNSRNVVVLLTCTSFFNHIISSMTSGDPILKDDHV